MNFNIQYAISILVIFAFTMTSTSKLKGLFFKIKYIYILITE